MKKYIFLLILLTLVATEITDGQSVAQRRAAKLGLGMNLTYLENWWLGTREQKFADFLKPAEADKRENRFADISRAGFQTVRIPVNFGAWANYEKPYRWNKINDLEYADKFLKWALKNDLYAIIDLHHVEFDGSVKGADDTERIVWLWQEIARRYKETNPEKVFFEIRNEPKEMTAGQWRKQAKAVIKAVRKIAPNHTLVVGFHDWNGRQALVDSKPFADKNIIYTFHYYDPFIFTHQGATWAGDGLPDLKNVSFPFSAEVKVMTPESARGTWVEKLIDSYEKDSVQAKMFSDLKEAKDWSEKYNVPIFLGEFGSYSKYATEESRCRHAKVVYSALGKLDIPNAWWEWNNGFNMFAKGTNRVAECMQAAIDSYKNVKFKD